MNNALIATTLVCWICLGSGCQQAEMEKMRAEADAAQAKIEAARTELANLQSEKTGNRQLVHLVWFKMDPELTTEQDTAFIAELRKLDDIVQVNDLEIGRFQELGDTRAMSDLDIVMSMGFDSEDDYRTYQDHPIHLQLKQDIGQYLSGPPVTYDYWTEP
ncbi:MAG: Dabb family protein [Pirellulaceae bacterium]